MRTQSFSPGDVVRDNEGVVCLILKAHHDPHPKEFSHCGGTSARYDVRLPDQTNGTRWDWQFTLNQQCKLSPVYSGSTSRADTRPA